MAALFLTTLPVLDRELDSVGTRFGLGLDPVWARFVPVLDTEMSRFGLGLDWRVDRLWQRFF